ncbi:von Willebrand factor A [Streptococcus acidominimus]|uniref:von Willebrand factor A n=1 Tax=Streptococcus acidominimus TaxID=1326 RepID=A0A239WJU4_STRAI|nr:MucBP domain-containing protein [Streptococcus acidominimus]SNV34915.1 von Willebrand factor A [Streptococcus acidominimus]
MRLTSTTGVGYIPVIATETTTLPNEAPTVEIPELKVTRWITEDGSELSPIEEGTLEVRDFEGYEFITTESEEYVTTHIYRKIVEEVPNEAPTVEIPELKVTRWITEDGLELSPIEEGTLEVREFEGYEFITTESDEFVTTHIYRKIVEEVPNEAPTVEIPELKVTRWITEDGSELSPIEEGTLEVREFEGYEFITTESDEFVTTHIYRKIVEEVPNEAPTVEIPELKVTRWITEDGSELSPIEEGTLEVRDFEGYEFITTESDEFVTTHIYRKIVEEVPNEAPTHEVPEATIQELPPLEEHGSVIVHYVDEQGNTIQTSNNLVQDELVNTIYRSQVTLDGISTNIITSSDPSGATYDANTVKPNQIQFDGKTYEFVQVQADSAAPTGTVPVGQTEVTFVYKYVPQVETKHETSQKTGNVVVKYVDKNGNEIQAPNQLITNGVISNIKTTITLVDGVETDRKNEEVGTGLIYDTKLVRNDEIDFNNQVYRFAEVKQGDMETGTVVEGTTVVTYIYDLAPNTIEVKERQVTGTVITRYIDETNGQKLAEDTNIITDGVVAIETSKITKDPKGNVLSISVDREPTGLTYDTTEDKSLKDGEIALLRVQPTQYLNTVTGEVLDVSVPAIPTETFIYTFTVLTEEAIAPHTSNNPDSLDAYRSLFQLANVRASELGFDNSVNSFEIQTSSDWSYYPYYRHEYTYSYTNYVGQMADLSLTSVPYEFTRVDVSETGLVEEGTTIITYYYRPTDATWTPKTISELGPETAIVATLVQDW